MVVKKLATVTTTGILLLGSFAPAAFANTVIAGNGFGSNNAAQVSNTNATTVEQTNTAHVDNSVDSHIDTGNNSADNLTGGSASINTGDAGSSVGISNAVNLNQAQVSMGGTTGGGQLFIEGNGAASANSGSQTSANNTNLFQTNKADLNNEVDTSVNTGVNAADNLTGGDASIRTGTASTFTNIMNQANGNWASLTGTPSLGNTTGVIAGNGALSTSAEALDNQNATTAVQDNRAYISNEVEGKLQTGNNSADNGTNSSASILTGGALFNTNVLNRVNANTANIDMLGGGGGTGLDKILGNGAGANNSLSDNSNSNLSVFGTNKADLSNQVESNLHTGANALDNATGGLFTLSDPSILTGHAVQQTTVQNEANDNQLGVMNLGGQSVSFSFDPLGLLGGLL